MSQSPFHAIQNLQEIQREGWMPEATHEGSREAEITRLEQELKEARDDAERLYLCIKDIDDLTYHELDCLKKHETLTGKPLSFG